MRHVFRSRKHGNVKGLELSRQYFTDCLLPELERSAPALVEQAAFGLVGPGSECYGYDDEISRDHDWGPRLCIWVPETLPATDTEKLQQIYESLPATHLGYGPVQRLDTRVPRDGVIPVTGFYRAFLGTAEPPRSLRDWLLLPEEALSVCTNGKVFRDDLGEFTRMRSSLEAYFPRDIWLKKIASRLKAAGQHAQYNLERARLRSDALAFAYHTAAFVEESARLSYLVARKYRPHAKWLYRGLLDLDEAGQRLHGTLNEVTRAACNHDTSALAEAVEHSVHILVTGLNGAGLEFEQGNLLYDHGIAVEAQIEDPMIREGIDTID